MKTLLVLIATVLLSASAFADEPKTVAPVKISPVPGIGKDPVFEKPKAKKVYCEKIKGPEKLCIPKHKENCTCASE